MLKLNIYVVKNNDKELGCWLQLPATDDELTELFTQIDSDGEYSDYQIGKWNKINYAEYPLHLSGNEDINELNDTLKYIEEIDDDLVFSALLCYHEGNLYEAECLYSSFYAWGYYNDCTNLHDLGKLAIAKGWAKINSESKYEDVGNYVIGEIFKGGFYGNGFLVVNGPEKYLNK